MNDIKIDYNTANIVMKVKINNEATEIFLPPVSQAEIRKNAFILGEYSNCIININPNILMIDWDLYLERCIKKVIKEEGITDDTKTEEYKNNIMAMLERGIVGGYYFDITNKAKSPQERGIEAKSLNELSEETKNTIRSLLLFFIVALRYTIPNLTTEESENLLKSMKIKLTSLSVMDYKNTITIQSSEDETLKE